MASEQEVIDGRTTRGSHGLTHSLEHATASRSLLYSRSSVCQYLILSDLRQETLAVQEKDPYNCYTGNISTGGATIGFRQPLLQSALDSSTR